jgi:hypothetical protein
VSREAEGDRADGSREAEIGVAEQAVEDVRNVADGTWFGEWDPRAAWWTPPADVAKRDGTPREALIGLFRGREIAGETVGRSWVAAL